MGSSNAVSGWKLAVKDGKVSSTLGKSDRRSRNMCGLLTDGRYIHVQTSASHTEYEVAQYVRDRYDVKLLLGQDAGGSTGMQHRRAPRKSSRSSASHTPRVSSIRSALSMTLRLPSLLSRPSRRTRKYRLQSKKSRPRPAWRKRPSSICSHTNTANSS